MARFNFHEARTLHLRWDQSRKGFEIRLMYGNRYLTPQLWLTPFDWYRLLDKQGRVVTLGKWIKVWRTGMLLNIAPLENLDYGVFLSPVDEKKWPPLEFKVVYDLAQAERGARPEEGWEKVYEREMEKERESWSN